MRAKGFAHRELALAWGVLTHNLWMLARMRKTKQEGGPAAQSRVAPGARQRMELNVEEVSL